MPIVTSYQMRVMESLIEHCEEVEGNGKYVSFSKHMNENSTTQLKDIFIFTFFCLFM